MINKSRLAELQFLLDKYTNEGIDLETLLMTIPMREILDSYESALAVVDVLKAVQMAVVPMQGAERLYQRIEDALSPFLQDGGKE